MSNHIRSKWMAYKLGWFKWLKEHFRDLVKVPGGQL